ncbi:prolyl 4-hydroxylase subunit alpha-1 [Scaptodrosophila lebanonensis]|uniref:procollagen-proline 4-dioxygenase n=1 Tax=Drosophila lebanonensis TaxID=7225 RepID=A0A6J2T237_DROLE|nr:prolyl 4-hydroxylase subunit alpha-1 [Scaptodrosophila lebanonensis]
MSRHCQRLAILALILLLGVTVRAEYYSSVSSMIVLGDVELELLMATRDFLKAQQEQLETYRDFIVNINNEHIMASEDFDDYLGNPLHAFKLLKRMVKDWKDLYENVVADKPLEDFRKKMLELTADDAFPDLDELRGAVKGLARLQQVYNLTAYDMADGVFNGIYEGAQLQWHDCFDIAVQLFELKQYKNAIEWFMVAADLLRQLDEDEKTKQKPLAEIHEYLALANYQLGHSELAHELLDPVVDLDSTSPAESTREYLNYNPPPSKCHEEQGFSWFSNYTRLCQGRRVPESTTTPLKCFLDSKRHAIFRLAPLKVEQVHLDPDINVYHGILTNSHIAGILEQAEEHVMQRSGVAGGKDKSLIRDLRVSQQTWLNYSSPIMEHVHDLVAAISGFDMKSAEIMQVANYGVGGQYEPHPDYFDYLLPAGYEGDRISTSMFYLSDVAQGGYTVFTRLNVFLRPIKGAMVMWHNLHRSLRPDVRTQHAGCPVLVGSKRIGNIWIHSGHQEFSRPCELFNDGEKSTGLTL